MVILLSTLCNLYGLAVHALACLKCCFPNGCYWAWQWSRECDVTQHDPFSLSAICMQLNGAQSKNFLHGVYVRLHK